MKQIVTYTYEAFDGKIFDNEDECLDYELAKKAENIELTLLNGNLETLPNSADGLSRAMFIIVNKQEDIDFVKTIAEECGYGHPWETFIWQSEKCEEKLGIYCYDDRTDKWVNFDDKFAEIKRAYDKCFKYRIC